MTTESMIPNTSAQYRTDKWTEWDIYNSKAIQVPSEQLPTGTEQPRTDWVTVNRARAKIVKTAISMHKWNLAPASERPYGDSNQTMQHIITDCSLGPMCTDRDLMRCNRNAKLWIRH